MPKTLCPPSPKPGLRISILERRMQVCEDPGRSSLRCANQQQTSGLSSLVIGKYFYVLRDHEYCLVFDQLQIAELLLGNFNVNRIAPLADRFHFHERAGSIDVFDSCAEVASAIRLAIDLEEMRSNINHVPCFPLVDISLIAFQPAMKQVYVAEEVVHERSCWLVVDLFRRTNLFNAR